MTDQNNTLDANYVSDLIEASKELNRAADALVAIVGRGLADHDSIVGAEADHALRTIGRVGERVNLAIDDPDYRVAGLLRGNR